MEQSVSVCELSNEQFSAPWPDGLIELGKDHQISRINPQTSLFLGWLPEELIGRTAHQAFCLHSTYCDHSEDSCPFHDLHSCSNQVKECYWVHKDQQNIAISYRLIPSSRNTLLIIFQTCESNGYQVEELKKLTTFTEINPSPYWK